MPLDLISRVVRVEGLRTVVALGLAGTRDELLRVREVVYDLGPTFVERRRTKSKTTDALVGDADPAKAFEVEVDAYGDFQFSARVAVGDARFEELTHTVAVAATSDPAAKEWTPPSAEGKARPASALAAHWVGTALPISTLVLGYAVLHLSVGARWLGQGLDPSGWPAGLRYASLAVAGGALGAAAQASFTLTTYLPMRAALRTWVPWLVLRIPTGAVVGAIVWAIVWMAFLPRESPFAPVPAIALAGLSVAAGFASGRFTTWIQEWLPAINAAISGLRDEDSTARVAEPTAKPIAGDVELERDVALAELVLRGQSLPAGEIFMLAERLKRKNKFGHARRLFGRVWNEGWSDKKTSAAKVGQRFALTTYKDPDLPAGRRFARALEILGDVERLELTTAERQESLGQRGAIHKRRWQVEGQRADLDRALGFYLEGHELGVKTDQGYNGINAAFVLDLLAREDAEEARASGRVSVVATERAARSTAIRRELVDILTQLMITERWLQDYWWFYATLAEAQLGLGDFAAAIATLRDYNRVHGLGHDGPPLHAVDPERSEWVVPRWEFESTLTQLATMARLQVDLAGLLSDSAAATTPGIDPKRWRTDGRETLRSYLGEYAPGLDRAETGKVGLALSGGGFRASFVHIGVLAYLAERDMLRRVEVLSCVSGGSIVGAHYYLELQRVLETRPDRLIAAEDYLDIVGRVEEHFLAGVQTNIRCQVFGTIWSNLRAFLQPGYTTTRRLGVLYERELYARVDDGRRQTPRYLHSLIVRPAGEEATFAPKYDNWRRRAKVPMLVLNATTLNTGHNWQFTATWMGEPPLQLAAEIESNYELRRLYHWEAPRQRDVWRHRILRPFAPPDYRSIRLGEAVAASSCVPGLFEPLVLPRLYPDKVVRLVDGGVHDNQGTASLIEQDCNVLIVSDASGQMEAVDDPSGSRLGVSMRAFNVSMARVRDAQYRELEARTRTGLIRGLMFMHLKRDLDSVAVDWVDCQDPHEASDDARPALRRGVLTGYGIQKSIQTLLSGIRTDLDSFTDLEAYALMLTGYRQAADQFACLPGAATAPRIERRWAFQQVEPLLTPGPAFEEVQRQLAVGGQVAFKIWRLSLPLQAVAVAAAVAAVYGLWWVWTTFPTYDVSLPLGSVKDLGWYIALLAAGFLAPRAVALWRYRQTIQRYGIRSLVATVLALLFKLHLLVFDPRFLSRGRLDRLLARRPRGER
jgi:predicted acylesterase/phospholipase RssA